MSGYGVEEVARVLNLSRGTIRGLVKQGFVKPARGPGRAWRFSFKDLVVLRAARDLYSANIPIKRINRSLLALRRHLPEAAPLSGLHIAAVGSTVVVREKSAHWHAESGQYLLALDVEVTDGRLSVIDRRAEPTEKTADDWFDEAFELEDSDRQAAAAAYQTATELDARFAEAYLNWGRLLHAMGALSRAERVYRSGLRKCTRDPLLFFNLGVLLEEARRADEALQAYLDAIALDPALADAHFNLAQLYNERGEEQAAFRHYGCYRRLTRSDKA